MKIRLHQFLSKTGIFTSKNDIIDAIRNSELKIEGRIVTKPNFQFNKNKKVTWKDKELKIKKEMIYLILNKPEGYLSTRLTKNDGIKKSVFGLLPDDNSFVCVGRLDEDTSGLLIITNDGDLVHKITSPLSNVEKTYKVVLEKPIKNIHEVEKGLIIELEENGKIDNYQTKPCKVELVSEKEIFITLTEGKKREVRRMFEAIGNKVVKLERVSIGRLNLEELKIKKGSFITVDRKFIETKIKN
jgi:16S rRNA pseudouridine516 synthase